MTNMDSKITLINDIIDLVKLKNILKIKGNKDTGYARFMDINGDYININDNVASNMREGLRELAHNWENYTDKIEYSDYKGSRTVIIRFK